MFAKARCCPRRLRRRVRFPPVYVTVIAAGERSGNLTGVLEQYISYLRVSTGFRSRLITALIYPAVLVVVAFLVVTYVVTYAHAAIRQPLYRTGRSAAGPHAGILLSIAMPLRNYFLILLDRAGGLLRLRSFFGRAPTAAPWPSTASSRAFPSSARSG